MSYSRRQLYALGETFGDSATRMEAGGRIVYGGGGGGGAPEPTTKITESGPTTESRTTTSSTNLPGYINANSENIVGKARAIGDTPYQAFTGQRVAEFSPDMLTAMERMRNQGVAGQTTEASGLASLAGQRASDYGMFNQGVQQFMNPYMQNVVDIERRKAQEAADQQAAALSGQAVRQGAFGGSGAALQQRALRRDTAQQLADLQAQGLNKAYESAVNQYNTGISNTLSASQQLGGLGQNQFGQETDLIKNLGTSGDIQRQREQGLLDVGYGDFIEQRDWAARQLGLQKNLSSGLEYDTSTTSSTDLVSQPGKTVTQTVAAGGEIRSYADGGITSLSDQQIAQRKQMPISDLARLALQAQEMENARLRAAQQNMDAQQAVTAQGPTTVYDDEMNEMRRIAALGRGIGGLEMRGDLVGNEYTAAGGGIVAFANEGAVPAPYDPYSYGYTTLPAERQAELAGRAKAPTFSDINVDVAARARFKQMNGMPLTQEERTALVAAPAPTASAATPSAPTAAQNRTMLNRYEQGIAQLLPTAERKPADRKTQADTADAGGESAAPSSKKRPSMLDDMYGPIETEMKAIGAAERKALEDVEKDIKDEAKEGNSFADKARERLEARMKGLEGQDKVAVENSILQFGLGLLTVKGAKDKAKALGELGLNTLKGHGDAMKDLQAKQERYEDAELELQKIEMGERRATRKDLRDLQLKKAQAENGVRTKLADLLGKRADTVFDMYKLEETNRNALAVAGLRKADGESGGNKQITAAEAAFQRDPEAQAIRKNLENVIVANNPTKRAEALRRLREIQENKYQQYGVTMNQGTASTSAQDPLGLR